MSNLKLEGVYTLIKNKTEKIVVKNLITDIGKTALLQKIGDVASTVGLQFFAVGTGSTAANVADTELATEVFRKPPSSVSIVGNVLTVIQELESEETNGVTIREAGIFGINATITPGSGILISRVVLGTPIVKDAGDVIDIKWELTLT